jgi:hypothetical protein
MSKMDEPAEGRWNPIFNFRSPLVNVLLIPYCYRDADGGWYSELQVYKGVLFDRTRIFGSLPMDAALPVAEASWPEELMGSIIRHDQGELAA